MTSLRQAMEQCHHLMRDIAKKKGPAGGEEQETPSSDVATDGAGKAAPGRAAGSRAEAYRQLAQAAAVLRQLEPHSPIPYLIQRAVELGQLPFPELMRALIREPNVLAELSREFGLPAPTGGGAGAEHGS
jgi:type VI secretion system protein ImpA